MDSDTCGTDVAPCASLAVAVPKLASAGDKIIISGTIKGKYDQLARLSDFPSAKFSERKQNLS